MAKSETAGPVAEAPQGMRSMLSRRQLVMVVAGVMLGMLLSALDQTIVGTAMPRIIADLNGLEHYAWVFTAYMLASTVMVPIYGKLSDIYGRRRFFLGGMALFLAGSVLSGASQTMFQLILFRGLQGLGAGAMMPIVQAIIGDIFPPAERGKWQGLMMGVFGLASVVGPTAGGWITDNWGWRLVFYVNLPVGAAAMLVAAFALPRGSLRSEHRIDYAGAVALVAGAVPLLLGFTWAGTQYAWGSPQIVALFAFATFMFVVFLLIERRTAEPIISLGLFKSSIFSVSVIATFLASLGMFGAIMYLPLFVQGVVGNSAASSGEIVTPMMFGFIASAVMGGQVLSRTGRYKLLALAGFGIAAVGMLLLSHMDVTTTDALVVRNMAITGLGIGAVMSIFTIVVQNAFSLEQIGQVTAALQFFRSIGATIGVAVLGSVMNNGFRSAFENGLPQQIKQTMPASQLAFFDNPQALFAPQTMAKLQQGFNAFGPQGQQLFKQLTDVTRSSLATAITEVFAVSAGLMVLAWVSSLFLREIPLRKSHSGQVVDEDPLRGRLAPTNVWPASLVRQALRNAALALAAIGVFVLLSLPKGAVTAHLDWQAGDLPKASVAWTAGTPGASNGTVKSVPTASTGPAEQQNLPVPTAPTPAAAESQIESGSTPVTPPAPNPTPVVPSPSAASKEYVVKPGDTLSSIAANVYGDPRAWHRIAVANAATIPNPNLILPGEVLVLPDR